MTTTPSRRTCLEREMCDVCGTRNWRWEIDERQESAILRATKYYGVYRPNAYELTFTFRGIDKIFDK